MSNDEKYMKRCLELAKMGSGNTAPNPMVGSVIVHQDRIIGEGYHRIYGQPHAEMIAIDSVKDKSLLKDSTIYVNLEPCAHYGHTPPCAERIVKEGIPRVVLGMRDPNYMVSGKGIEILRKDGCTVTEGVLEKKSLELNRRFTTYHAKKRPYIILKWAQTLDGFIDKQRAKDDPIQPNWITNEVSKRLVHKWRSEEQAILVGAITTLKDNPALNVREWQGRNPLRLIIDHYLEVNEDLKMIKDGQPTVIFTDKQSSSSKAERLSGYTAEIVRIDFARDVLTQILDYLYNRNVISLFVEGGEQTITGFFRKGLWDEARVFIGNKTFHSGVSAPNFPDNEIFGRGELLETQLYSFRNES